MSQIAASQSVSSIQVSGSPSFVFVRGKRKTGRNKDMQISQMWWCTPVITALRRWRQEDHEFQGILSPVSKTRCLKKTGQ
jgi:hypothetical protein